MIRTWKLQEAKNRLSEVVDEALSSGPQLITRRGAETVVVLSVDEYWRLTLQQQKLSAFLAESPLAEVDLDLRRDQAAARPDPQP